MSSEKEQRIREARTIEATRKGLMGLSGKLGVIAKNMGQPMIATEEGGFFSSQDGVMFGYSSSKAASYEEDDPESDELPTMEEVNAFGEPISDPEGDEWTPKKRARKNFISQEIGHYFQGLDRGVHLEIKYITNGSELRVNYKGYKVYEEANGSLLAYNPYPEWEEKMERLYTIAKKIDEERRRDKKQENIEEAKRDKKTWIAKMKELWGL